MSVRGAAPRQSSSASEADYSEDEFEDVEEEGAPGTQTESERYSREWDGEGASEGRGARAAYAWEERSNGRESAGGRRPKPTSSARSDSQRSSRPKAQETFAAIAYSSGNGRSRRPRDADHLSADTWSPAGARNRQRGATRPHTASGVVGGYEAPGQRGMDARRRRILQGLLQRDPRTWDIAEVRHWLDSMDLSQHVQKFGNYGVDGRTLLKLTDDRLRDHVGIHSDAQRHRILSSIVDLKQCVNYSPSPPRRRRRNSVANVPRPSPHLYNATQPGRSEEANLEQLQQNLDRVRQRAEKLHSAIEAETWQIDSADKEVERARKELAAAKRDNAGATFKMNPKSKKLLEEKREKEERERTMRINEPHFLEQRMHLSSFDTQRARRDIKYLRDHFEVFVPMDVDKACYVVANNLGSLQRQVISDMDLEAEIERAEKMFNRFSRLTGCAMLNAVANFMRNHSFLKRVVDRQAEAEKEAKKVPAKHEDPTTVAERDRLFKALGMQRKGGDMADFMANLSALLKRARVYKVLDEQERRMGDADVNEGRNITPATTAPMTGFTLDSDDPRLEDLRNDGLTELEEEHGEMGVLDYVVGLLKRCRDEDLARGMRMRCDSEDPKKAFQQREAKAAYVFNLFRTQRYLQTYEEDFRRREEKREKVANGELLTELETVKTAPKGQYDDFMKRLNKDLEKRKSRSAASGLTEAQVRQLKQESIINSSVLYQRRTPKQGSFAPSSGIQPPVSAM